MKGNKPSKYFSYVVPLFTVLLLSLDIYLIIFALNPWDVSVSYATYDDAVKDGAVAKGWIPNFVPKDAYDIRDSHNFSPENQHLEFSFKSPEQFQAIIDAHQITSVQPEMVKYCPTADTNDQLSYYKTRQHNFACLIVNWTSRRAYYVYRCCRVP
jgi:hypothetical protein